MRSIWVFIILVSLMIGWFGTDSTGRAYPTELTDVSWPNCDIFLAPADVGIVGINGGLALRPNLCLAQEALSYRHLSVYVNTGYPGPHIAGSLQIAPRKCKAGDKMCPAYNYGYNSGLYDINYSLKNGILARQWWLDVETENSWDQSTAVNRAALQGMLDALGQFVGQDNLGFYSYPGQWDKLTGNWRNNYPQWVATGNTKRADAQKACRADGFTGGPVVLAQYTPSLDVDIVCSPDYP